ncbi:MAG: hypothetical protein K2R98_19405 [Gemmataceae bacterium]|nr:hypothetical protein [Gemmataceae bacterium]
MSELRSCEHHPLYADPCPMCQEPKRLHKMATAADSELCSVTPEERVQILKGEMPEQTLFGGRMIVTPLGVEELDQR